MDAKGIVNEALFKARHERDIKYVKWCYRVRKRLPELANRVFALRTELYNGCGFHYALERQLGVVIRNVNSVSTEIFKPTSMIMTEIVTTDLYRELARIEKEIKSKKS